MKFKSLLFTAVLSLATNCFGQGTDSPLLPFSDPSNEGGWKLNTDISDEFEAAQIDHEKWLVQGTNGEYKSNWIGRAPSQFSPNNVRLEDGKLKLQSRWEPDFDYSDKIDTSDKEAKDGRRYENITTAAVISKKQFHYGYMEIKCKAADASVTSSFWMTGNNSELDIFEFSANPAQKHKTQLPTEFWSSIHDWSKGGKSTWTDRLQLDWRVADGFHVYGAEWQEDYLKFYADGKLIRSVSKDDVPEDGWVITNPLWVWVDSEVFPWHGIPVEADLPVDYEVEYIRIWQGKTPGGQTKTTANTPAKSATEAVAGNLIDNTLYGFEGPLTIGDKKVNWWIAPDSNKNFSIVGNKAAGRSKSLKFTSSGDLPNDVVAFAPNGSTKLEAGSYVLSMKVFVEPNSSLKKCQVIFQDPWLELKPFDLASVEKGKWVTLTQEFNRSAVSGPQDRPKFLVKPGDVSGGAGAVYFDDLSVTKK